VTARKRMAVIAGLGLALPVASEARIKRAARLLTNRWRTLPIAPRCDTLLGISFRSPQVEALGLDAMATLARLLELPFEVLRVAAYWARIEAEPGRPCFDELDAQVDAAEAHGKQIIVCVGAVKAFGYPEFFVPGHRLAAALPEGRLIEPGTHRMLLDAATGFVATVVERYRDRASVVAWQVEHEAVDPLGVEHTWRLSEDFVAEEVDTVRVADPARPVVMNGFLPTSLPVRAQQWWRTRDQGDSLAVAQRLADIVGVDFYPRHGLVSVGGRTCYLDGSRAPWEQGRRRRLFEWAAAPGRRVMITEGQAEPWETVTNPPNPAGRAMFSCTPEHVIDNYNQCLGWRDRRAAPWAYLFWGAEYWIARLQSGDPSYLDAVGRILTEA
jgi:hypothetical protein